MYRLYVKRLLDVFFSILLLPILFFLVIFVSIFVVLDDKGSVFFLSQRLGRYGEKFTILKFRTMYENVPDIRNSDGSTFNSTSDERVTRLGRFLRKTSLDEIPQLLNVLKGEMSFVGPRPDLPDQINRYNNEELEKLSVRPGITGYNQAFFRNSVCQSEKFKNDVYYTQNYSFILDVKIIFATIYTVLARKNINIENSKGENNEDFS